MSFTDEDLKRLKDHAYMTPREHWCSPFERPAFYKALIARLEAAEKCIGFYHSHFVDGRCVAPVEHDALEAWLRSCGRER